MSGQDAVLADLREVVAFLCGEGGLDGRQYGCPTPLIDGVFRPYWWRKPLSERMAALEAAWNRRATPASDEAVGDLAQEMEACLEILSGGTKGSDAYRISALIRALSARTAAPAEQGVEAALDRLGSRTKDAAHSRRIGGPHRDECKCPQCAERDKQQAVAYAKLGGDIDLNTLRGHLETMLASAEVYVDDSDTITGYKVKTGALHRIIGFFAGREGKGLVIPANLPQAARLAPIAPDARSVDGLSGEEREALERTEAFVARLPPSDHSEATTMLGDTRALCAAIRRLAGAKVQSKEGGNGN